MKVALVHDYLMQMGGAENVLEAISEIFPEAPIYTLTYDKKKTGAVFGKRDIRTSYLQKFPFISKSLFGIAIYKWLLPFMSHAIESFDLKEYDLIISDSSAFAKGAIKRKDALHICYCYTPTRYLWQIPEYYVKTVGIPWPINKIMPMVLNWLREWDYKAAQRPDYFLAISKEIQKRIKKYYNRDSEVIYPFADTENFKPQGKVQDYFLIAGRMTPYKRYDIVIEAFNELNLPLKVVGDGYGLPALRKLAKSDKIQITGRVSNAEMRKYFAECKAFIFPAEEDFGIVMLEAMACGRPVIAFKKAGALEIVKDGENGEFFLEQTPESIIQAVNKFDIKKYNSEEIREYSQKFAKKVFVDKIKQFIKSKSNLS